MNLPKINVPILLVFSALGVALIAGSTFATGTARADRLQEHVTRSESKISDLEVDADQNRLKIQRIEILSEQMSEAVKRIERKLDRRREE